MDGHAGELQRLRIDHREMPAGAHEIDGIVRSDRVEFAAMGMALHVEFELVVSPRQHPFAGLRPVDPLLDEAQERVERPRVARPNIDIAHHQAERQQMQMRFIEPRRRQPSRKVDDARRRATEGIDRGGRAGRQHLATPERHGFREVFGSADEDSTAGQDRIGLHLRQPLPTHFTDGATTGFGRMAYASYTTQSGRDASS